MPITNGKRREEAINAKQDMLNSRRLLIHIKLFPFLSRLPTMSAQVYLQVSPLGISPGFGGASGGNVGLLPGPFPSSLIGLYSGRFGLLGASLSGLGMGR